MKLHTKHTRRTGLTLIELLVTLTIIVAMMLVFSQILSSSQKVVTSSQALMRSSAAAEAISRTIRVDFQAISKDGFLAIRDNKLIFTTAGYFQSQRVFDITGQTSFDGQSAIGTGQIVTYGSCANTNPNADSLPSPVFYRKPFVMDGEGLGTTIPPDVYNRYFSHLLRMTDGEIGATMFIDGVIDGAPTGISVPAESTLSSLQKLWPVMNHRVKDLEFAWAETADASGLVWETGDKTWTHHNRSNWPIAIRIQFKVLDKSWPEEFKEDELTYEIICYIGQ